MVWYVKKVLNDTFIYNLNTLINELHQMFKVLMQDFC